MIETLVVPIEQLSPDPNNARKHSQRNIDAVAASLKQFGQRKPIVVTRENVVIAGNGTLQAAKSLGWKTVTVTVFPFDDPVKARAFAIADNRTAELAEWDEEILVESLRDLNLAELLDVTGFTQAELLEFEDVVIDDEQEEQGSLLALADVTIADPKHEVAAGDVFRLRMPSGDVEHVLVVSAVMKEWSNWVGFLVEPCIFAPFPDPFITGTDVADKTRLILVQPDTYLAGHLLDKHAALYGESSVVKVAA